MNIVIITGASSGLGSEFAKQLDSKCAHIDEFWLIARRKERLQELSAVLKQKTRIFSIDLTQKDALASLQHALETMRPTVRMLINCAGYGILGSFQKLPIEEQSGMIALNCDALIRMTYLCLPFMKRNSRIIQLASSAAFLPQAEFNVYAATKSFVYSFSRALAEELRSDAIYVTAVCPGPIQTEFFDIAQKYGKGMKIKELTMVSASQVVKDALRASAKKKTVTVYGGYMKSFRLVAKLIPHQFLLLFTRLLH